MGPTKHTVEQEAQTRYESAFEMLACRCLGEPYNFHRVAPMLLPGLINSDLHSAKIVAACLAQANKSDGYTPQSIALACGMLPADALEMAQRDAEMTLPDALEAFLLYQGQWAELRIAKHSETWVMRGLSSEEIQVESKKLRKEYGLSARLTSSDGVQEFERRLLDAIDGVQHTYPVTPYLKSMREIVPYYAPGDYIVVAALSGQGKTYDALNQIYHNSLCGVPSCYINLEMTPEDVQERIWQMHTGKQFKSDLRGSDAQMSDYLSKWDDVKKMPFKSHNPGRSIQAVVSTIRQDWHDRGIQFACVDYGQKMKVEGYKGARNYELSEISAELRALALELNIPMYVMAQLKQEVAKTHDKRGGMYDVKDCADFTQDATMVQILYRPSYFDITHFETASGGQEMYPEGYADRFIAKGRKTGTAFAVCRFDHIRGFYDVPDFAPPSFDTDFNPASIPDNARPSDNTDIPF
jgi:phage pi2 protein 07